MLKERLRAQVSGRDRGPCGAAATHLSLTPIATELVRRRSPPLRANRVMLCSKLQPVSAAILNVLAVGAGGHPHRKYRAFARFARHGHVAAHHARELAREGKAQSSAAEVLRGRGIGLGELFEQLCLLLRSHADAGVGDSELDEGTAIAHLACRKLDLARFGELT